MLSSMDRKSKGVAKKKSVEQPPPATKEFEEVTRIVAGQTVKVKVYKAPAAPAPDDGLIQIAIPTRQIREKLFYRD